MDPSDPRRRKKLLKFFDFYGKYCRKALVRRFGDDEAGTIMAEVMPGRTTSSSPIPVAGSAGEPRCSIALAFAWRWRRWTRGCASWFGTSTAIAVARAGR